MIIYIHIPKCSGSSFKKCFKHNFKKSWWNKNRINNYIDTNLQYMFERNKKINTIPNVLADHFPHGIHKIFNTKKYKYVTILRNPIERFISNFYFLFLNEPDCLLIRTFYKNNNSITRTLETCINEHINNNQIVKQLSGIEPLNNIIVSNSHKKACVYYRGTHANIKPYSKADMKDMLSEAKLNVHYYDFVGFQENSYIDYQRFCKQFNLKYKKSERMRHTNRNIFKIRWNNPKIKSLTQELNKYDIKLYEYAKNNSEREKI